MSNNISAPHPFLETFLSAYIETALWSSNGPAFGHCPCCEEARLLDHYPEKEFIQEALCASCGCAAIENCDPLDRNYSPSDLSEETKEKMRKDCSSFLESQGDLIREAIESEEGVTCGPDFNEYGRAGHDFWLTRNRAGCGYWDGDWPRDIGRKLTEAAHAFGEINLWVSDKGEIEAE